MKLLVHVVYCLLETIRGCCHLSSHSTLRMSCNYLPREVVGAGRVDLHFHELSLKLVYVSVAVDYVILPSPAHNLCWDSDVALFDEDLDGLSHQPGPAFGCVSLVQGVDALKPFLLHVVIYLVVPNGGGRVRPRRVGSRVDGVELNFLHEGQRFLELLFRLSREANYRISGDGGLRYSLKAAKWN